MEINKKVAILDKTEDIVIIPDGIEEVKFFCFGRYVLIEKIIMPNSIKEILFPQGARVSEVHYQGTIEDFFDIQMSRYDILRFCTKFFVNDSNGKQIEVKEVHFPNVINKKSYSDFNMVERIYLSHDTSIILSSISKSWNRKEVYYEGTNDDFIKTKVLVLLTDKLKTSKFYVKNDNDVYVPLQLSKDSKNNDLPSDAKYIEENALEWKKLDKLIIPSTVMEFKKDCFKSCKIKELYFDGSIEQ